MHDIIATIVTYRSDLTQLGEAIDSLKAQTPAPHIILADNASEAAYQQQLQQFDGVTLMTHEKNYGFGCGHNRAIAQAPPSRYLLLLNPDAKLHEGCLQKMRAYLDSHGDVGLVVPKVFFPDGTLQPLNKRLPNVFDFFARRFLPGFLWRSGWIQRRMQHYEMRDVGYDAIMNVPFVSGCCLFIRRDLFEQIGGFDERFFMYLEDCDLGLRIREAGYHTRFLPDAQITHHWQRGSHRSRRLMWQMIRSMWVYYRKWGWKWW